MVESKSRKTGEQNRLIARLTADGTAMREQIDALEARMVRLEAEVATLRQSAVAAQKASSRASLPPAEGRRSRRPGAMAPPPLPRLTGSMLEVTPDMQRSFVDISDIAELVESMPPPGSRSKK